MDTSQPECLYHGSDHGTISSTSTLAGAVRSCGSCGRWLDRGPAPVADRFQSVWSVFSKVAAALDEHLLLTEPRLFGRVERRLAQMERPPFEFCVVDEAQDIGVAELRSLAAPVAGRLNASSSPVTSFKGPDAVLLASLGGRYPPPLAHLAGQLPHRPSDPAAGGPAAAARDLGCGRQHRLANRRRLPIQWRGTGNSGPPLA